jgi:SAM-dependent methyltransferase
VQRGGGYAVTDSYDWVPDGVDVTVPDASRVYDYALGGVHNFTVDREFWHRAETAVPGARAVARANRAFLGRAVRELAVGGVTQFLDIGSGIPTLGNVHEVAQEVDPSARVMYVDRDPIAVQQSKSLLVGNRLARVIEGDLRQPATILNDPEVLDLLDFSRPVAVMLVAVLHFIPDSDDPAGILSRIADVLVSGSYVVVSHFGPETTAEGRARQKQVQKLYESTPTPVVIRDRVELAALFDDRFAIVEPGLVAATDWRPEAGEDKDPPQPTALVAVARRR